MSTILQVPDATQFRAYASGDEQALAGLFRSHYDALLENTSEALGPDLTHFAPRVVQQAMLATWTQRAQFQDGAALVEGLNQALRDEAARQKRKHSALHHGHSAGNRAAAKFPTADQAVEQLLAQLHAPPVDHAQAVNEAQAASKSHAAAHVQKVASGGGWKAPLALVVIAGLAIVGFMKWAGAKSSDYAATKALQSSEARAVSASRGQRGKSTLNDGSVARIGSDTKIKIPSAFGTTLRTLEVSGTASFTVAAGQAMPFVVRAGNAVVTATGTILAVRAFDDDSIAYVSVDEGSVKVNAKDESKTTTLEAGQALRVEKNGTVTMIDANARDQAFSWTRDSLVFTNIPVREVLPELNRWFDLKAKLGDDALGARPVTLRVGLSSSGEALKQLAAAGALKITFDKDDKVVLADDPKPASPAPKAGGKKGK